MADRECEELLKQYPKFRALASDVEGCLQVFERSKEWSDYVSGLSRLIKVFQRPEYCDPAKVGLLSVIPEKATIARRLAQSTNPILPNGVHRKALDVYRVILSRIGRDQLALDLALWSHGLFALFPHANEECRLVQIKMLTESYVPLGPHLTPCLDGLILSLLPGVEDEASSCYHASLGLLHEIRAAVGRHEFFRSAWWVLGVSVSTRLPLLLLLQRSITAVGGFREQGVVPDHTVAVASLVHALQDSSVLVQRAVLDLLLTHVPYGSDALPDHGRGVGGDGGACEARLGDAAAQGQASSWMLLTLAALRLYARRDMSLTRRLNLWLSPVWEQGVATSAQGQPCGDGGKVAGGGGGGGGMRSSPGEQGVAVSERGIACISWAVEGLLRDGYADSPAATLPFRVARALLDTVSSAKTGGMGRGGGGEGEEGRGEADGAGSELAAKRLLVQQLGVPLLRAMMLAFDHMLAEAAAGGEAAEAARGGADGAGAAQRRLARERFHFAVNTVRELDLAQLWRTVLLDMRCACCAPALPERATAFAQSVRLASFFFSELVAQNASWGAGGVAAEATGEAGCGGSGVCGVGFALGCICDLFELVRDLCRELAARAAAAAAAEAAAGCDDERTRCEDEGQARHGLVRLHEALPLLTYMVSMLAAQPGAVAADDGRCLVEAAAVASGGDARERLGRQRVRLAVLVSCTVRALAEALVSRGHPRLPWGCRRDIGHVAAPGLEARWGGGGGDDDEDEAITGGLMRGFQSAWALLSQLVPVLGRHLLLDLARLAPAPRARRQGRPVRGLTAAEVLGCQGQVAADGQEAGQHLPARLDQDVSDMGGDGVADAAPVTATSVDEGALAGGPVLHLSHGGAENACPGGEGGGGRGQGRGRKRLVGVGALVLRLRQRRNSLRRDRGSLVDEAGHGWRGGADALAAGRVGRLGRLGVAGVAGARRRAGAAARRTPPRHAR